MTNDFYERAMIYTLAKIGHGHNIHYRKLNLIFKFTINSETR